jgi:Holliday junction resolvase
MQATMANRERRKGLEGEREVAAIWRANGFEVRGLEGTGDHLVVAEPWHHHPDLVLHSEVKRQNRLRTEWIAQAEREVPAGTVPVVAWRPDRGKWWSMIPLEDLARLLA